MSEPLAILALGSHPDDVELACGGTLAAAVARGQRVGIVHLTRGEASTRGTVAERRREAEEAAAALGVTAMEILDCGDGGLRTGDAEIDAVVAVLRAHRPEVLLVPPARDRHPDHARAHRLVTDAAFYAGLARRAPDRGGPPHRPAALHQYMQHDGFEPSFVVDVGAVWERKLAALACYRSQLHQADAAPRDEPLTKVASREFALAVTGRAQHYGQMISAAYGEPFRSLAPLAVDDLLALRPRGLR